MKHTDDSPAPFPASPPAPPPTSPSSPAPTPPRAGADVPASLGILGAGRVGTALARRGVATGLDTRVATAQDPSEIGLIVEVTAPGARAVAAAEAAAADVVILAIPLHRFPDLDPSLLEGRTVIDVMNYWPPVDGHIDALDTTDISSSELVAERLPGAVLVRTFNHIGYHEIDEDPLPAGSPGRRALAVASDNASAAARVAALVDAMGFDPIDAGPLAASRALREGGEIFDGRRHDADEIRTLLTTHGWGPDARTHARAAEAVTAQEDLS